MYEQDGSGMKSIKGQKCSQKVQPLTLGEDACACWSLAARSNKCLGEQLAVKAM